MEEYGPGAEVLRTGRLILRRFRREDTDRYFEIFSHPTVKAGLHGGPSNLAEAWRSMAMVEGHWAFRGYSFFAVESIETGELVGRCGPWFPETQPALEVGWTLHPDHHGKGFATEAAKASGRWILERQPGLSRLIHLILPTNTASQKVAARLGGATTGEVYTHPLAGDVEIWATPREAFFR